MKSGSGSTAARNRQTAFQHSTPRTRRLTAGSRRYSGRLLRRRMRYSGAMAQATPAVSGSGWNRGSYSVGSGAAGYGSYFTGGSYAVGYGSYGSAVGSFGGFRLWEWEWEWRFGSFAGSFRNSSWRGGSFAGWLGSFAGSFGWGSFAFPMANGSCFITADEYDRIMYLTLRRCPLDCFGYGIHIV